MPLHGCPGEGGLGRVRKQRRACAVPTIYRQIVTESRFALPTLRLLPGD